MPIIPMAILKDTVRIIVASNLVVLTSNIENSPSQHQSKKG